MRRKREQRPKLYRGSTVGFLEREGEEGPYFEDDEIMKIFVRKAYVVFGSQDEVAYERPLDG